MNLAASRALDIDYPAQDAVVAPPHYTIRVGAPDGAVMVEVSIDRGPWRACRRACGYWWHDWDGIAPGAHEISARGQLRDGAMIGSTPRRFTAAVSARKHSRRK